MEDRAEVLTVPSRCHVALFSLGCGELFSLAFPHANLFTFVFSCFCDGQLLLLWLSTTRSLLIILTNHGELQIVVIRVRGA